MIKQILGFTGEYRFLSNFYPARVEYDGVIYPTSEHAYQASKTESSSYRRKILLLDGPGKAKRFVREPDFPFNPEWPNKKIDIMTEIVRYKFTHNENLKALLLETGSAYIEETNTHGDIFWGVVNGEGENHLGEILMKIRNELSAEIFFKVY